MLIQQNKTNESVYLTAAYMRLSKEDLDYGDSRKIESNSISNQKQLIMDYVKDKPEFQLVSLRIDDGYTGTNYDRPAFQLMLEDIKAGRINCIIIKDLSRFGREYIDTGKYIDRIFPYYGVRLIAINDGVDTITRDMTADFGITIRNLVNDNYCRDISMKIRSSLTTKRKNGEFTGPFAPYGYKRSEKERNKLVIDEGAACVVRDIFRWKLSGMNNDAISNRLNNMGILCPMEYKCSKGYNYANAFKTIDQAKWTPMAVRRILTNEVYIGKLVQGIRTTPNYKIKAVQVREKKDWCVVPDNHEPIITQHTFSLVQRVLLLDTRTSPHDETLSPLSGLVVCGDCGSPMTKKTTSSGGKKYAYYVCSQNKANRSCSPHRMKVETLEDVVLSILQNQIEVAIELSRCIQILDKLPMHESDSTEAEAEIRQIEMQIKKYSDLKTSLYADFKDGIVSQADYLDINSMYTERSDTEKKRKEKLIRELELMRTKPSQRYLWLQDFVSHKNLSELTRIASVELIEQVRVFEGKRLEVCLCHQSDMKRLVASVSDVEEKKVVI